MSLQHTESFSAFEALNGDDAYNAGNTTIRNAVAAALRRAGYAVTIGAQATVGNATGWMTRPDPVSPDRVALVYSNPNATNVTSAIAAAAIRKILPSQAEPLIGGFSVFIPNEYVPSATTVAAVVMRVNASYAADTVAWTAADVTINNGTNNTTAKEVFRVTADLLVKWGGDAAMTSKPLVPGRMNYLEYRISDGEVRVWLDDVLVLQKTVSLNTESIAIMFESASTVLPNTYLGGAPGRWAISNWYNLFEDAQAPNVRLGPTTRVIGARADADVAVDFSRPVGYASNAAVVGQNLVDTPPGSLQSTTVGDEDVYTTSTDTATASGQLIHAVAVKVLAANLESASHTLRPFVRTAAGVEVVDKHPREFRNLPAIGGRALYGIARRPTDNKIFAVGVSGSIYATPANGTPYSTWTQLADDGGAITFTGIAFRADGTGVISRSDGKVMVIAPGSDLPGAAIIPNANATALNYIIALPNGTFLAFGAAGVVCRSSTSPENAAGWVRQTAGGTSLMLPVYAASLGRVAAQIVGGSSIYTSDDNGVTWTARATGVTSGASSLAWDGSSFISVGQLIYQPGYMRRSADGLTWTNMSGIVQSGGGTGGVASFAFGDPAIGTSLVYSGKSILMSSDGFNTHRISDVAIAGARAGCVTGDGDWIIVGDSTSGILAYTPLPVDIPLTPLAGYQATFNSAAFNPTTGAPWTPAEAAATQFGMRLTS